MGRPKKEKDGDLWRVLPGRVLVIQETGGKNEIWAQAGQIVRINHPVLEKMAEGQFHKMERLSGLPAGAQVHEVLSARTLRLIDKYDRERDSGDPSGEFPAVARPTRELEEKIEKLLAVNQELRERIEVLEAAKEEQHVA